MVERITVVGPASNTNSHTAAAKPMLISLRTLHATVHPGDDGCHRSAHHDDDQQDIDPVAGRRTEQIVKSAGDLLRTQAK